MKAKWGKNVFFSPHFVLIKLAFDLTHGSDFDYIVVGVELMVPLYSLGYRPLYHGSHAF